MPQICGVNAFRWAQLILALMGFVFSLSSHYVYFWLVILFAVTLVYEIMLVVCLLANKFGLSGTQEAIIEIVLGLIILVAAIWVAVDAPKDTWLIITIVVGFLLPALLFVTAYEKS